MKTAVSVERRARAGPAIALLVIAMVSIQSGAALAKRLFPLVGPEGATALRLCFAALMLGAVVKPWRHQLTRRQGALIAAYGVVLGLMNLSFYLALSRIPLGVAVALEFTGPFTVALLGSRRATDVLWAALAVAGLAGILPEWHRIVVHTVVPRAPSSHGTTLDPVGVGFALGAGVCWALYIIFGQRAGASVPGRVASALGMATAACVVGPLSLWRMGAVPITGTIFLLATAIALLSSALPYSLEMLALQRLPTKTFGIFMSVEPAIAAVLGLVFLHEQLSAWQWAGIACVIAASVGSIMTHAPPRLREVERSIPEITPVS